MSEEIFIPAGQGQSFMAYMSLPAKIPAPIVIVIQEIFGVNQGLRDKCDGLAQEGFIAVCPDLFWRIKPGIQLTDQTEAEWKQAFTLFNEFDIDHGIQDLITTLDFFRNYPQSTGKVSCLGYCLGGKLAFLMAARSNIDASIGYYGVGLENLLEEAASITHPLMLHIAEEDKFSSKDAQKIIKDRLKDHPYVTIHSYPGLDHAFTRKGGEHYDENGARVADQRSLDFLNHHAGS